MKQMFANSNQVGTVWGLAWSRNTKSLYASAFMKKYSGFGPSGTGAIYRINPATATVTHICRSECDFRRRNSRALINITFRIPETTTTLPGNLVGKNSLGGIAISDDQTKLYVINLAQSDLISDSSERGSFGGKYCYHRYSL